MSGPEPGPRPVWERPWSLEEIRKNSQSWSLAADAGLLQFLQEFSQQTISRTHEIKKQVDGLIHETKAADCRLHNVFNDFLMLSNTQFIENRVYDEEVEEPVPKAEAEKIEQEKTREQKEADLIPKVQEAVNYGLLVLDSAFEQLDIKAGNSDSEEEEANERVELILEPKDLYIDRPLPYLIGSQLFMEQEDVGLGDLSSEEGSLNSDPDSVLDSEEEKDEEDSDDDFGNQSENDQKPHIALISDEEEEEDLFGDSEKEEEEEEVNGENARPKRNRPTSFADELAARIKGDVTSRTYEGQTITASGEAKTKRTVKEKKDVRKVPSDDEEDDMFKPPKLTDEDFSPFGSRGGLFSGGIGLFDDDESDLFSEAPKDNENQAPVNEEWKYYWKVLLEASSSKPGKKIPAGAVSLFLGDPDVFSVSSVQSPKEPRKPPQSTQGKTPHSPAPAGLFDNDDDDFFVTSNSKPVHVARPTVDLFDEEEEEEEDLFKKKAATPSTDSLSPEAKEAAEKVVPPSSKNLKALSEVSKKQKGLFSDEEDSEDLFSSAPNVSKAKAVAPHSSKLTTKKPLSLFDDDDEEENLFGETPAKKQSSSSSLPKQTQEKTKPSEAHKKTPTLLFSSDEEDQWSMGDSQTSKMPDNSIKELKKPGTMQDPIEKDVKKISLFEEDDEEDLFAVAKDSKKKAPKASLLFEEDADSGGSLFGSPPPSVLPAKMEKEKIPPAVPSLFSDEEEEAAPFGIVKPGDKQAESASSGGTVVVKQEEKPSSPGAHFKTTTGVFQDEALLFSHKLQQDNDPDVDLFARSSEQRAGPPPKEALFGDEEDDDDFFTSVQPQPPVAQKKTVVKKDNFGPPLESHKFAESSPSIKQETDMWKLETAQDSAGLPPHKIKEPSSRIGKLQADLAINPATLLPGTAPKISGVKAAVPGFAFTASEPDGVRGVETASAGETGVSFEDPARADTLHSVNKSRITMKGKRRPQTRAARRLAAQESSEAEDMNDAEGPQLGRDHVISPAVKEHHPREVDKNRGFEKTFAAPSPFLEDALVPGGERIPVDLTTEDSLFDSSDIFAKVSGSKSTTKRAKDKEKASEDLTTQPQGKEEKQSLLPMLDEPEIEEDLFQSVKQKPSKKKNTVSLLEGEDDLFTNQKAKKKTSEPLWQQDVVSKNQDIFEDDIFATEAIKPAQRTKEKEKALESNLFDDNIDIFADLTIKPKEKKSKKKVEPKSIFDDEMDDIFSSSSGLTKMPKPKSQSTQSTPETRLETKVSSTFDDPLNALGGQ
ncbi:WASH complex subunit 2-like isoform X2 [Trichosurus vulpecula]|uniref:WASH complex subunit 2-like isoform X2 n=1 Tax=Trichosurus vulpecula TaxID=9337 RepID=UPI00186B4515|nr:WASH complex subunit 2-like isoform X2 [Trichosurus vulpecula]